MDDERHVIERPARGNVGTLERWASALAGSALTLFGLSRRSLGGALLGLAGVALIQRGVSGRCAAYSALELSSADDTRGPSRSAAPRARVIRAVTIDAPREIVYRLFWHAIDTLPLFMKHLGRPSRVVARRAAHRAAAEPDSPVGWDAVVSSARENELIEWNALPAGDGDVRARVRFLKAPGERGTEVIVALGYRPRLGPLGVLLSKLQGEDAGDLLAEDLRCLKQLVEAGDIATKEGQPHGSRQLPERSRVTRDDLPGRTPSGVPQWAPVAQPVEKRRAA